MAEDARETARTFDGLERLAKEANEFRYSDLEKLLLELEGDRRKLAARIALIPVAEDMVAWQVLRPIILANLDPNALDDLNVYAGSTGMIVAFEPVVTLRALL